MDYCLIGLGTMGSNLALNISTKNKLHLYNRTHDKVLQTIDKSSNKGNLIPHETLGGMLTSTTQNKKTVITMLPHGKVTTNIIEDILPLMNKNDIIMDMSNEYYTESLNRSKICCKKDVKYLGIGISGGALGALNGPALMIGGSKNAYYTSKKFFDSFCGNETFIDLNASSGHFTKMVHNGIEYGMLQTLADVYSYCNQNPIIMQQIISNAKETFLNGYLVNGTSNILEVYELDKIKDIAQMNNTGLWCSELSYKYKIPAPTINSSVDARIWSNFKKNRNSKSVNKDIKQIDKQIAIDTLTFGFCTSILEGYKIIDIEGYNENHVKKAWTKDTIIECELLNFDRYKLYEIIEDCIPNVRKFCNYCINNSISVPTISNNLQYYDFINTDNTSMSLVMATRNFFGNHSFEYK